VVDQTIPTLHDLARHRLGEKGGCGLRPLHRRFQSLDRQIGEPCKAEDVLPVFDAIREVELHLEARVRRGQGQLPGVGAVRDVIDHAFLGVDASDGVELCIRGERHGHDGRQRRVRSQRSRQQHQDRGSVVIGPDEDRETLERGHRALPARRRERKKGQERRQEP